MSEWQKVPLSKLLTESKVESENPSAAKRIRVRLNVNGVEQRPYTNTKAGATKYYTRKAGQFIYGRQNLHKGAFGVVPKELDGFESSSDIPAFDVSDDCFPEWIELFLKQGNYYLSLDKIATGVGSRRISPKKFLALEIPLPPKETQKEISEKVSALTQKHFSLLSELNHQADLLKKLRQRILQEAIEGKLTAKWRAENPDVEPASALLERIQAEKAQLVAEKKIRKQKKLPPISEDEIPFELPQGWEWDNLGNCSINKDEFRIPISKDERARRDKTYDYYGASGVIDKIDGFTHEGRNLLIGEDGANLVARSTPIAFFANGKYWVNNHAHVIGTIDPITLDYLHVHINAIDLKPYVTGGFQPKLSQGNLNRIVIAVPPLAEQKAIVAKVETLLALCDQLEGEITQNQDNAEKLMQAVLREAFSQEQA